MELSIDNTGLPETVPENTPVLIELTSDKSKIVFIRVFKDMHELLKYYMQYCYKSHNLNHFLYKHGITTRYWYEIIKAWNDFPGSHDMTYDKDGIDKDYLDRVLSMHLSSILVQSSCVYDIVEYPMNVNMFEDSAE